MSKYFLVENDAIVEGPINLPRAWRHVSGLSLLDDVALLTHGWMPENIIGFEPFDGDTQIRTGPVFTIQAAQVDSDYVVRDKTQQELDDAQRNSDNVQLRSNSGKDAAIVLIELVDWLLANTAMQASDFTPDVRAAHQRVKTLADRIKT